ncbi:MAG: hypothetical protein HY763_15750 [Planctomycetes bacterium]|nr:hypothetical protein [Planctomycetota bacterium]
MTHTILNDDTGEIRALRSAALHGEAVPRRVLLAPWGHVESTHGAFVVDDESGRLVADAFQGHATDLPIDYEHQTLGGKYAAPSGQAPAAGWIKNIRVEPGVGILADIEWTPQAAEMLATKQYRYLSPVAIIRKADRKLVAIHSAALTNKPAIVGMQPIVSRDGTGGEEPAGGEALTVLRAELGLPVDCGAEQVLSAAQERLCALREEVRQRQIEERVSAAMRAGKLTEAQRSWAAELAARDAALFEEWVRTAPTLVTTGRTNPPARGAGAGGVPAVEAHARAEFRSHRGLAALTTEEAYVADAIREAATARK